MKETSFRTQNSSKFAQELESSPTKADMLRIEIIVEDDKKITRNVCRMTLDTMFC